jgi:hypothetical protein
MITNGYKANFETLCRAIRNDAVILMECTDAKTGQLVMVVCAVEQDGNTFEMKPFAKLFDGNPYEELIPPAMEEPA